MAGGLLLPQWARSLGNENRSLLRTRIGRRESCYFPRRVFEPHYHAAGQATVSKGVTRRYSSRNFIGGAVEQSRD